MATVIDRRYRAMGVEELCPPAERNREISETRKSGDFEPQRHRDAEN